MTRVILTLLGGFQARLGAGPVALPTRKIQACVAYLALPPGRRHSRDKLAALLWGDQSQGRARNSLRQALFAVRRILGDACLKVEGGSVALNAELFDVDALSFERLAGERTPEALGQAVELYGGDLLAGLTVQDGAFEEWLMSERERLRELALETLARLLAAQRDAGAPGAALETALRLVALDPLQESVHRTLMRLYSQLGRRGSALHQYQLCVGLLQRELDVEPDEETRQLYQQIVRSGRRSDPGPVAAPAAMSPSPAALRMAAASTDTPLVGREEEMARLGALYLELLPHLAAETRKEPRANQSSRRPDAVIRVELPSKEMPLFGRDADRAQLAQALGEASRSHGQLVLLVGEAGIGKTSLLAAFAADALSTQARVLLGRCYESTQILPFGHWVDAVRAGDVLAHEDVLGALHPAWRAELTRLFPEIAAAGSPPSSDNALRLFESVAQLLEHLAAEQLLVLMLEDVHWADEMSLRLLAFMARRISSRRVLLIVTSRDEELADAATARRTVDEISGEPHVTRTTLAPLSRRDTIELIRSLARVRGEPDGLAQLEEQVWAVSEGNPFVAVETTRALLGGALLPDSMRLPLPECVRAMIAGRLDRLSDPASLLAAVAAVIGREFEFRLLHRASGLDEASVAEGVEELVRCRVLHGLGERFEFTHHRLHAVVHDRLLPPRRKLLHRRVGEALEILASGDPTCDPLVLAVHFHEGEVWDKAVGYLHAAGVGAMARSAHREAVTCLEQALALLQRMPETREGLEQSIDLRFDLRVSLHAMGELERWFEHLRDAERCATTLKDRRRLGFASVHLAHYHWLKRGLTEARRFGQTALATGEALADSCLTVAASLYLGVTCVASGNYREAGDFYEMGLKVLGDDRGRERCGLIGFPAVMLRGRLAETLAQRGEFRRGLAHGQEALQIAEELDHPYSLAMACHSLGLLYGAKGHLNCAASVLERGLQVADKWNLPVWVPTLSMPLGRAYALMGRSSEAISILRSATQRHGMMYGRQHLDAVINLGEALACAEQLDDALSLARQALALGREEGQRGVEARAVHLLAEIAAHRDPPSVTESDDYYRQALGLAGELGMQPLVARCHLGLGELYQKSVALEKAKTELNAAAGLFRSMEMTFWLERAKHALG